MVYALFRNGLLFEQSKKYIVFYFTTTVCILPQKPRKREILVSRHLMTDSSRRHQINRKEKKEKETSNDIPTNLTFAIPFVESDLKKITLIITQWPF